MSGPVLNRRLVLEAPERLPDGAGGFTEVWVAKGTLWAAIRGGTGRERVVPGAELSRVAYRITVRAAPVGADSRPRPGQRLREGSRLFVIEAVREHDPRGRYLDCFAREEVAP